MLSLGPNNYVVDTGPDFRQQMLREDVKSLQAVLFTHEHKDHVAGLDDVRAFNFMANRDMEVYCTPAVEKGLRMEFSYVFGGNPYPGIPRININTIGLEPFVVNQELEVTPIRVMHYKMPVTAYRVGDFTYITDAKTISEEEIEKTIGTKVLIINALHRSEHISHFNLEQALEVIAKIKPERAYLTHISHLFGLHEEVQKELPENVYLAYDGLTFEV